jgi:hypothetical protein
MRTYLLTISVLEGGATENTIGLIRTDIQTGHKVV